mmetsp:Transcript_123987/g.396392  ORF Transcript_123987/g.396392 Transcript_123987/m.396392 type:complete len:362 (+) Transcript_123987:108-1193(+)
MEPLNTSADDLGGTSSCLDACTTIADMMAVDRLMSQEGLRQALCEFLSPSPPRRKEVLSDMLEDIALSPARPHPNGTTGSPPWNIAAPASPSAPSPATPPLPFAASSSSAVGGTGADVPEVDIAALLDDLRGVVEFMGRDLEPVLSDGRYASAAPAPPMRPWGDDGPAMSALAAGLSRALLKTRYEQQQVIEVVRSQAAKLSATEQQVLQIREECRALRARRASELGGGYVERLGEHGRMQLGLPTEGGHLASGPVRGHFGGQPTAPHSSTTRLIGSDDAAVGGEAASQRTQRGSSAIADLLELRRAVAAGAAGGYAEDGFAASATSGASAVDRARASSRRLLLAELREQRDVAAEWGDVT